VAQIAPAPAGQEVAPDGAVYRFQAAPGGGDVVFVLRARRRGPVTLDVQVGDTPPAHLPQWVWP
jgi:hypothetical protein